MPVVLVGRCLTSYLPEREKEGLRNAYFILALFTSGFAIPPLPL